MSYKAVFIGVDKYASLEIDNLVGAKRDALALWSIFHDNIKPLKSIRLVDDEATHFQVKKAISTTLSTASEKDTIIISFAGHGSSDHRLVVHDTVNKDDQFDATSIAMSELAELFTQSKAKAILFLLDCCFSGEAPARVFAGRPNPRSYDNPFTSIAGTGRVLISACAIDEVAYEDPKTGHGLLTEAFLNVLQEIDEPTEILAIAAGVIRRVRGSAARLAVTQTPNVVGKVEGGLTFPPFKRGECFLKHFPDLSAVKTDGTIDSLKNFGIPSEVLEAWKKRFRNNPLNELQVKAINDYHIMQGESLLVVAPTSSGKTFIGESAAIKAILDGRKAVFLLPYKALTNEKFDEFSKLYSELLNLRVIRVTGDRSDTVPDFIKGKYDLALLTYEMFLNLIISNAHVLQTLGLVVVDEAQFITDPNRGINVELLLTYLLTSKDRGVNPQIIALSAVIGGTNNFDQWLSCKALITHKRPVPLQEAVLDRNGTFQYLNKDGEVETKQLIPPVKKRRDKESSQDIIVPLIQYLLHVNPQEKVIIFRNSKGPAQGCANYLARDLGLDSEEKTIAQLPTLDNSDASNKLRTSLEGGTAFHTSNLSRDEKQIVERVFRDPDSEIRVLVATTGVAAGINTPASTVVLAEQEFLGENKRPFLVSEYKNMAGRAGRKGFHEEGKSIILANTPAQRELLFAKYVQGTLEPLSSSFSEEDIATWILKLLTQVQNFPRNQVSSLLGRTYGGFLRTRQNPDWFDLIHAEVEYQLERMIRLEIVEMIDENIHLTLLGATCGKSSFSFNSSIRLVELLKKQDPQTLTSEHLMALIQALPELDDHYTPVFKKGTKEQARAREVQRYYGDRIARQLQSGIKKDQFEWLARCKRAAILLDWITGRELLEIEQHYSPTPYQGAIRYGNIIGIANVTRFHLRSAVDILHVLILSESIDEKRFDDLLLQLEEGLPRDCLTLLDLPFRLTRGEILKLRQHEIKTKEAFVQLSTEELKEFLENNRIDEITKMRDDASKEAMKK